MKKELIKILPGSLICLLILFSACQKKETSEGYDILNFSDETTAAADLVASANEDLNKIKVMYKKNEYQLDELKTAMNDKDIEKVKKITDDLVYVLNDGMGLGESAVNKIEQAEAMNVNADFKEYLDIKAQSLRKQMEAFENRRQAARLLRDSFGTSDPKAIEKSKEGFKEKEEAFQNTIEEARKISKKADDLAKETSKKTNQ
ncbi:MAG: hypothetical protein ACR2HG_10380 [Pyrinomonadaceae bacterium]